MLMGVNSCWVFLISCFLILSTTFNLVFVSSQCLQDQLSLLLQMKDGFEFDPAKSTKLVNWNVNVDCCNWNGVGCDTSGRVISLELDEESISSGIENSTTLFKLHYLQKLNLAFNEFSSYQIPSEISNLENLVYLNLSGGGFGGQIPIELSYLRKLVSLDLSSQYIFESQRLKLVNPNLKTLAQNLVNLEELYLDNVDLTAQKSEWFQALASSLPRLRILSLRKCGIEGPIDTSLSELRSLSVIQLDRNNLSTTGLDFFANFSNLRTLSLVSCNLVGTIPPAMTNLSELVYLDFSFNNFTGPIPPAMTNLSELVYLDFSNNNFTGPIPLFHNSKYLSYINLSRNELTGSLSPAHFGGLPNLVNLNLGFNSLTGNIPSSIFTLPSLKEVLLSNNKLSGQIVEFPNASSSLLDTLDLSANRLNGSIPGSLFEMTKLKVLSLSSNSFTGNIQLESIMNLVNLSSLDLSYNKISVDPRISNPSVLPQLSELNLASCKLKMFPDLMNQSKMSLLDLSDNQITGEVPNWIWEVGNGKVISVNLSFNFLVSLQKPYNLSNVAVIDLHSNQLQGEIPTPPASSEYVDYSSNKFNNSIPPGIGNNLRFSLFFSVANNRLTGSIPDSLCNATFIMVIDLSNNSFTGKIPSCVFKTMGFLSVLNLERNNLTGSIPDTFPIGSHLKTLDLSSNALQGKIPGSLINCTRLEVLNIGNNNLEDTFPCNLKNSSNLRVLVLRSNRLHGDILCPVSNDFWPELQIIDVASNNFRGVLTPEYFSGWRRMMLDDDNSRFKGDILQYSFVYAFYYQDKVSVTLKGQETELVKILKVFTSIDFSNNKFTGEIPDNIGDLRSLYLLNLSHNAFTGRIPSSIGKLKSLGSLDLSVNELTGEIPATLASLTFLALLNLSFNKLFGKIPTGPQLQTFTSASYQGNTGLCGFPLNTSCIGDDIPSPSFTNSKNDEIKWEYVLAATGYTVGLASFISVLLLCKSWRDKFFYYVDKLLLKIVNQKGGQSIAEHTFRNQPARRL